MKPDATPLPGPSVGRPVGPARHGAAGSTAWTTPSVVRRLASYRGNKAHSRHIHADECEATGLKIEHLEKKGEEKFQDLVLTVHHCFMLTLMNTGAYKIIENQEGVAFVKQIQMQAIIQSPAGP